MMICIAVAIVVLLYAIWLELRELGAAIRQKCL